MNEAMFEIPAISDTIEQMTGRYRLVRDFDNGTYRLQAEWASMNDGLTRWRDETTISSLDL